MIDPTHVALPPGAAGQWCTVRVRTARAGWVKIEVTDEARGQVVREAFLGRQRGAWRGMLLHVPAGARALVVWVVTPDGAGGAAPEVRVRVLRRTEAAVRLLAGGWRKLAGCLRGDWTGLAGRVRVELGQAPARAGEAPPYAVWVSLFDRWGQAERAALVAAAAAAGVLIEVVIVGGEAAASAASAASVAAQWVRPVRVSCVAELAGFARLAGAWLVVLRAGDILAAQAVGCFARAIGVLPDAPGFYADADCLVAGVRAAPLFKPGADPWLARGGLLSAGARAVRPDWPADGSVEGFGRIAFVLTHVADEPVVASSAAAAAPPARWPLVSIVIPTSGRSAHVLRCLRGVLADTDYPDFEVLLAVARREPGDRRQARNLAAAAGLPRVRVLDLEMAEFNYAAVNNAAVRAAAGGLVLLLNDDVRPVRADWLRRMVAETVAPAPLRADIVGARLLYGHGRVQHGGVILGLAHLCEHAFRLTARDDGGPHGVALLDRRVSAVTAACLLVRREVWDAVGGMDAGFAVALNDVDFCLRAGAAGAIVIMAATVALYHYEGTSLGRHYSGARAALEAVEVQRLRNKWQSVIADDPFYNPQASLEVGREFTPAFPPRLTPLHWIRGEDAAPV